MATSVEAEILQEGIWVYDEGRAPQETRQGQKINCSAGPVVFTEGNSPELTTLTVRPEISGNGVRVAYTGTLVSPWQPRVPNPKQSQSSHSEQFGGYPNSLRQINYGNMVYVDYLGHPDRDIIVPVMSEQSRSYNPRLTLIMDQDPDDSAKIREVVITSPVVPSLHCVSVDGRFLSDEDEFDAQAMFMGQLTYPKGPDSKINSLLQVNLLLALNPIRDGRLRVDSMQAGFWLDPRPGWDASSLAETIAKPLVQIRALYQFLAEHPHDPELQSSLNGALLNPVVELIEDSPSSLLDRIPTISQNFPKFFPGYDVREIIAGEDQEEMRIETQRVAEHIRKIVSSS